MGLAYNKYLINISYISLMSIAMRLGEQELKQNGRLLSALRGSQAGMVWVGECWGGGGWNASRCVKGPWIQDMEI